MTHKLMNIIFDEALNIFNCTTQQYNSYLHTTMQPQPLIFSFFFWPCTVRRFFVTLRFPPNTRLGFDPYSESLGKKCPCEVTHQ
jgi:hypothetical protein